MHYKRMRHLQFIQAKGLTQFLQILSRQFSFLIRTLFAFIQGFFPVWLTLTPNISSIIRKCSSIIWEILYIILLQAFFVLPNFKTIV